MNENNKFSGCTITTPSCKCFDKLSDEELKLIDSKSIIVKYKQGEIICKQGSFSSHVMIIDEGLVKVYIDNGIDTLVLRVVTENNIIGLSSLKNEHNVFPYSIMAYVDTTVKQIDINTFNQILAGNSIFAKELIDLLVSNGELISARFFSLIHKQTYGRMADILLCLSDRVFKNKNFNLPLTRKDLAELTGMSSETVIRILKKLHDDKLILMDGKSIHIIDYEKLIKISELG